MTTWIKRYRRQAEGRHRRLDDLLATMSPDEEATSARRPETGGAT